MPLRITAVAFIALVIMLASCGSDENDAAGVGGSIIVSDVWSRPVQLLGEGEHMHDAGATPEEASGAGTNGVVYLTLSNEGDADDRLISARSEVASAAELHMVKMVEGVMQMRQAEGGIDVPSGETVSFEPGGQHVMLVGLTQALETGDEFDLSLTFERAGELTVRVEVRDH